MDTKKLLEILTPYCDSIRYAKGHYVCYPKGLTRTITVSGSPGDINRHRQVFREFRRCGIIIKELK